jgi:dihydrofolate reductase
MGRKTFETLPNALPNRLNIVVTRDPDYEAKGGVAVRSIEQAIGLAREHRSTYGNEIFLVGGGELYRQTMDQVDRIYLTLIHKDFEGDAFYPDLKLNDFKLVKKDDREGNPQYSFLTYERK